MLMSTVPEVELTGMRSQGGRISYSQLGEDIFLAHVLRHRAGFYVDVGCHDPFRFSNTAVFHLYRGWTGINIDADPRAIERFRTHRPADINIHCGVSDEEGELVFTTFKDGAQNSFDASSVARSVGKTLRIEEVIMVPVRPLRDILDQHLPPGRQIDFMDIDCEGFDDKVIAGNDWKRYRPAFLCVEIHGLKLSEPMKHPTVRRLAELRYKLVSHHLVTSIFQRMD